jgi:hypothetical protein
MAAEARSRSIPVVYKYDPNTGNVTERKERLRTPDKWERVIYNAYVQLRNDFKKIHNSSENNLSEKWEILKRNFKYKNFEFSDKNASELDNVTDKVTYLWKAGMKNVNNHTIILKERVRIHTYYIDINRYENDASVIPVIPVIIFQPSWLPQNEDPNKEHIFLKFIESIKNKTIAKSESWADNSSTLYIVNDPRFLELSDDVKESIIATAGNFWTGNNGELYRFMKYNTMMKKKRAEDYAIEQAAHAKFNTILEMAKAPKIGPKFGSLGGSRRSRRRKTPSRKTRRTRK